MPSETVVELKTQRPVHEQPQHSYTMPSSLYLDEKIYEQENRTSSTATGITRAMPHS